MNKLAPVFYVSLLFVMLKLHHNIVIVIQGSRYPEVLTSLVLYIQGFLCSGILMSRGPYVQGSLCPRILMSRGCYVQGLFCPGIISFRGSISISRGSISISRGSNVHNIVIVIQGFRYPWVLTSRVSYVQGFLCPGVILSNYYYAQGLLLSGILTYITFLLSLRGSDILGFLHSGVLTFRDSYVQSF